MLARNLPGVVVLVTRTGQGGRFAIKKYGCDTLVLDDGFQYLRSRGGSTSFWSTNEPFGNGPAAAGHPSGARQAPEARQLHLPHQVNGIRDPELEALIAKYRPDAD